MTETYRTTVDRAHASRVIPQITNGRQVTHNVLSYVKAAVVKNPDNYLPTYTPPRYQAPDRPPADDGGGGPPRAAPTAETASKVLRGLRV